MSRESSIKSIDQSYEKFEKKAEEVKENITAYSTKEGWSTESRYCIDTIDHYINDIHKQYEYQRNYANRVREVSSPIIAKDFEVIVNNSISILTQIEKNFEDFKRLRNA